MFKKGDKVRIIDNGRLDSHQRKYVGKIGIVDELNYYFDENNSFSLIVKLPDGNRLLFNSEKLKLVTPLKEMLKTGSLVLVDNTWYVAILDGIPDAVGGDTNVLLKYYNPASFLSLKYFDDELRYYSNVELYDQKILQPNSRLDVQKIAQVACSRYAFVHMCKGTPICNLSLNVIWERKNPQISELEKVIYELREQLQKAEKELSAMTV